MDEDVQSATSAEKDTRVADDDDESDSEAAVPVDEQEYKPQADAELDAAKGQPPAPAKNEDVSRVLEAIVRTSKVYERSLQESYIEQPELFGKQSKLVSGGKLKDFQQFGVDWLMARNFNASVRERVVRPRARPLRCLTT